VKLKIKNKAFSIDDILSLNHLTIEEDYFQEAVIFIKEWYNASKSITAHTSGSTGRPKSIKLSKKSMRNSAQATGLYFGFPQNICSPLSSKYIAGKMMLVRAIEWDASITLIKPQSNPLIDLEEGLNFMVMTPHQLSTIIKSKTKSKLHLVDTILLGGSPVSDFLINKIQKLNSAVFLGYGMTETMSHVAIRSLNDSTFTDHYNAVTGIHFDVDKRSCLRIHTDGLLEQPLQTNDVVELISETSFKWKSRLDDVINTGGLKVYPQEIEKILIPYISQPFYVVGKKHPELGEEVTLYIESSHWNEMQETQLFELIEKHLTDHKKPRNIVAKKAFQFTENGKLKRIAF